MQIFSSIESLQAGEGCAVSIGTFDGLHTGHIEIIRVLDRTAKAKGVPSVLLTFRPHPRVVLNPADKTWLLSTYKEKQELVELAGVDIMIEHPFTTGFSKLDYKSFIDDYLMQYLKPRAIVVGFNHMFGHGRTGDFNCLSDMGEDYGFDAIKVTAALVNRMPVSSSRIRKALMNGDIDQATDCLGRRYSFSGVVVEGTKVGRSIGFPTANINIPQQDKLLPADGVYACYTKLEGVVYKSMLNIGTRPTVNDRGARTVEVHMMSFKGDAYDKEITVELVARIRDEQKFSSVEALKGQLQRDQNKSLEILV